MTHAHSDHAKSTATRKCRALAPDDFSISVGSLKALSSAFAALRSLEPRPDSLLSFTYTIGGLWVNIARYQAIWCENGDIPQYPITANPNVYIPETIRSGCI